MTKAQAKTIFEKYNPADAVVRCPKGRAKLRKSLDLYAKAAVNLYGIITRAEFTTIFNAQNDEQTDCDEVFTLLLPNVLKNAWYGFYKDYIVHYIILQDFDWVKHLEIEQADKPRYIPPKEKFIPFEWEEYEDTNDWDNAHNYLLDTFGYSKKTADGFKAIKQFMINNIGFSEINAVLQKYGFIFANADQFQQFFNLLVLAKNNTRIWENNGHTPTELFTLTSKERMAQPQEIQVRKPHKPSPNDPCPCGSGKKYKKCCALIADSGLAQLSLSERQIFYVTWYKLLDFVNRKKDVVDIKIAPVYPAFHDETELYKIREKLWENPGIIRDFLNSGAALSETEAGLLNAWEKKYVKGNFLLIKYESGYAVFMRTNKGKKSKLYGVKGMTTSIAEAMSHELPVMLETVLLPFQDKIIYDSFLISQRVSFGKGICAGFDEEYQQAKKEFGIQTQL
ncbi:hypothetical protein AGMMS50267_15080 [Spirochaetia bacterium]|nr:hypothetical protein AGMMS50267_15080 [Spirochaetia bacterium]